MMDAKLSLTFALLATSLVAMSDALSVNKFSSKNAYRQAFTTEEFLAAANPDNFKMNSCSLSHLQLLVRHGSRAPTAGTTKRLVTLIDKLRTLGVSNMTIWVNPFPFSEELTPPGELELQLMGKRFLARYPSLMEAFRLSNPNATAFYATSKKRTKDSGLSFLKGVDPNRQWQSQEDNDVLRFFDVCPAYEETIASPVHGQELDAFQRSAPMQRAISQVLANMRLPAQALTPTEVAEMYGICGSLIASDYDPAKYGWCTVFEGVDVDPFEYYSDMEAYYDSGYGFSINYESACPYIKKVLFNNLAAALDSSITNRVALSFAHAETVIPVIAAFTLYKDPDPLTSSNYETLKTARQWKIGRVSPHAANVAFLLWNCSQSGHALQIVVNERIDPLQPCSKWPCSFQYVSDRMRNYAKCNFSAMCTVAQRSGVERASWNRLLLPLLLCLLLAASRRLGM